MTMTSVAVGPVSLGTPPPMLTTKRYHLQQGMTPNSASPTPTKNYETLSKGKKSWSVRLGLSRQHQTTDDATKNWGTISGGSALSRQMLYGEPWIYGTVRSTRGCIDQCNFLTPASSSTTSSGLPGQLAGTAILVICSCPEFLSGTTRKLGNCRKCGGHRLARIPLGGTCRIPETSSRIRPSLAGVLRPSIDDPYDLMRRSRLVEPRSRARSISPNQRQANQRDTRSQSVRTAIKDRKSSNDPVSRTEWFDTEINYDDSSSHKTRQTTSTTIATTIPTTTSSTTSGTNDWNVDATTEDSSRNLLSTRTKKNRIWQQEAVTKNNENWNDKKIITKLNNSTNNIDSRKSILECNVNPYLLVKKQLNSNNSNNNNEDDDDLSDDLSDNALEHEEKIVSSSLFDPSKVKSIERLANHSAVAAIGGQRIRVFTEIREVSDDDNNNSNDLPVTKIPIPKISPKRPPRRPKETKIIIKSILKRGNKIDGYCKKNVFFNINNVILSPDKTNDNIIPMGMRKINKNLMINDVKEDNKKIQSEHEKAIVVDEKIQEKPKFITIPNIKELKRVEKPREKIHEARIVPDVKSYPATIDRKIDKNMLKYPEIPARNKRLSSEIGDVKKDNSMKISDTIVAMSCNKVKPSEITRDEDETDLEIEIEELKDQLPDIGSDEKELILKANDTGRRSSLTRSQSDKSLEKFEKSTASIHYLDTMRLSLRRAKDSQPVDVNNSIIENDKTELKNQDTPMHVSPPSCNYSPEYFQRMRPTSWSPSSPSAKIKPSSPHETSNDPGSLNHTVVISKSAQNNQTIEKNLINNSYMNENRSKIKIISPQIENDNICKITVTPRSSPLVHRLQVGGCNEPPPASRGSRRTSILINSDLTSDNDSSTINDNKVTISVGGEDSICNPTVISVNSTSTPKIKSSMENRTLVILENYKSNIVLESTKDDKLNDKINSSKIFDGNDNNNDDDKREWSDLTRESIISKLLEDSLKKARENGEILDESSGEAILRILKQSLLKNKNYENNNSDIEFKRIDDDKCDFVTKNIFLDENPYEIIKEPIYEEIPDEPPPLPLSPPPIEDFIKDRIYFPPEYKESYYKKVNAGQYLGSYLTENLFDKKSSDEFHFKNKPTTTTPTTTASSSPSSVTKSITSLSSSPADDNLTKKFELLNFLMDTKEHPVAVEEDEMVDDDDDEEEDVEDTEGDLEALYEQKETSMGDLSSKSSQISNVSDSSEECNIILTSSTEASKTRTVDIERTDSGVGSESSQASSSSRGVARRWRTGNATSSGPGSLLGGISQVISADAKLCEDCEQRLDPLITDSCVVYAPFVCRKCSKKRAERKEIITEIVETEQKYGRDLRIILEEFHRPMLRAGLLTQEQLSAIFLNVEELLEHNLLLADKLKEAVEFSQVSGDEDLLSVDLGKIFLESERMLHAFESYCTRQGGASLLLQNLEKEKELLRIFLKVSQMENTVLRRMNLNSFLMVPVQRVTKYPLLLARLLKTTPAGRIDVQETRKRLEQAQANIELHLEHMNAEAKDVTSTKLWRRISIIQNGRRSNGEHDMVNIKLRKMAVEVLDWAHEEARFVLEGRLLVAQPTDNNWKRGRTVKLAPVTAMLVTNGKSNTEFLDDTNDDSLFPRQIGIKEATLLLVKEKIGRYSLLREPLCLDKCIVCCETDLEDYFEIQELSTKETFIFKAEDGARTKRWCRTLQAHAQSLGAWRRRRGALPNIMICGVARS